MKMKKTKIEEKEETQSEKEQIVEENTQTQSVVTASVTSFESSLEDSFFYTSDNAINAIDNNMIYASIQKKYPQLNDYEPDSVIKKQLVQFLEDDVFVKQVLKFYNINIYDLFKLLCVKYQAVFKGPYLKKLKNLLDRKQYDKDNRRKYKS